MDKFIGEPSAVISGPAAWLLSRILRSPSVVKVLTNAPDQADIAATVDAIHCAGRAYENRLDQQRREDADPPDAVVQQSWSTKRAAGHLRISQRRVQELAPELGGTRVGREWRLPAVAIYEYAERRETA